MGSPDHIASPQMETWVPQDVRLKDVVPALQAAANSRLVYDIHGLDSVGLLEIEQANGVAFVGAAPHTDKNFPRWFVMLTLKAPEGTFLHTAPGDKLRKGGKSRLSGQLSVGEMLLFDAHQVHWVDVPASATRKATDTMQDCVFSKDIGESFHDELSIIIGTEVHARPNRAEAEAILVNYLIEKTPKAWRQTKEQAAAVLSPARRRAKP